MATAAQPVVEFYLLSAREVPAHQKAYEEFLTVKTTPKRGMKVSFNTEAVNRHISRYSGFQALLSSGIKDPIEAMQVYRNKNSVEKCFDDLKNNLDMKRFKNELVGC